MGEEFKLPENVALLSLEEKAKYVVELRKRGYSYKEIAKALKMSLSDVKKALRGEVRKDMIEELKREVEEVREFARQVLDRVKEVDDRLVKVESVLLFYATLKKIGCVYYKDGYCYLWSLSKIEGLDMKPDISESGMVVYRLNVDKYPLFCSVCYNFKTRRMLTQG